MKNNILSKFIYILLFLNINFTIAYSEQFKFNVTEIEILNNGNLYKGLDKGSIETDTGILINAQTFIYDKLKNTVNAEGNVKIEDTINNYVIFSDNAVYRRNEEIVSAFGNSRAIDNQNREIIADKISYSKIPNIINAEGNVKIEDTINNYVIYSNFIDYFISDEKIITKGYTEANIESEYNFISKNVLFELKTKKLSSKSKSSIKDKNNQIYYLDEFVYFVDTSMLKAKEILTITNYNLPKSDKFYFSEGIFDLKNKEFAAKDTKLNIHNNVFGVENNNPRIYSVSSKGDQNITKLKKGIFTSCQKREGCSPWSIKSDQITHDKNKKQLEYKNAILNVYDIPVFYFPKFFHPDPSVNKQTGLLKPEINKSNVLGSSITQPYFKIISKNKDYTFSPTWFDNKIFSFQNEYRQANENSNFIADFGFVNGYKDNNRSHLFANYDLNLKMDEFEKSRLFFSVEQVSNDTYLKVFDTHITNSEARPDNLNIMNNKVKLTLNHEDYNFVSGLEVYEDLNVTKNSDRYEYVLPYYEYDTVLNKKVFNGTLSLSSSGNNNLNNTNNLESNIQNNLNYESESYISKLGFLNNFNVNLKNLNSLGKKNSNYKSSPQLELMSLFEITSSLPLIKKQNNYDNYLTPKISFKFNPSDMKNYSSKSRIIDASNVFSNGRLGLNDTFESGKSLTLGIDFKKEKKKYG